jgi:hypothetical protein
MRVTIESKFNKGQTVYQNDVFSSPLVVIAVRFTSKFEYLCEYHSGIRLWIPQDELRDTEVEQVL